MDGDYVQIIKNGNLVYANVKGAITSSIIKPTNTDMGVSPALNLKLASVVLTSSSPEQKISKEKGILVKTEITENKIWKLTLKDSDLGVSITTGKNAVISDNSIEVPYTFTGDTVNQISIMITDGDYKEKDSQIMYYGTLDTVISNSEKEGIGTFVLPELLSDNYKIYILAENINEGYMADSASDPYEIDDIKNLIKEVEITEIEAPSGDKILDAQAKCVTDGVKVQNNTAQVEWQKKTDEMDYSPVTGNAEYNTTYCAIVKLAADEEYAFNKYTKAKINGKDAVVEYHEDGTITVSSEFTTDEKKIDLGNEDENPETGEKPGIGEKPGTGENPGTGEKPGTQEQTPTGEDEKQNQPTAGGEPAVVEKQLEKNKTYKVSKISYKVISFDKAGKANVSVTAVDKKQKTKMTSLSINNTVMINGKKCTITEISDNVCKNCKKLKSVTIGSNVRKIGKNAFTGCKLLKKITIKSKKLTKIGKNAFKNINKKAKFNVPKNKYSKYKSFLKPSVGFKKKTMKIVKKKM